MIQKSLYCEELFDLLLLGLARISRVLDHFTVKLAFGHSKVVVVVVLLASDSLKHQVNLLFDTKVLVFSFIVPSIGLRAILLSLDLPTKLGLMIVVSLSGSLLVDSLLELLELLKLIVNSVGGCLSHLLLEDDGVDLVVVRLLLLLLDLILSMQALVNDGLQGRLNVEAIQDFIDTGRQLVALVHVRRQHLHQDSAVASQHLGFCGQVVVHILLSEVSKPDLLDVGLDSQVGYVDILQGNLLG